MYFISVARMTLDHSVDIERKRREKIKAIICMCFMYVWQFQLVYIMFNLWETIPLIKGCMYESINVMFCMIEKHIYPIIRFKNISGLLPFFVAICCVSNMLTFLFSYHGCWFWCKMSCNKNKKIIFYIVGSRDSISLHHTARYVSFNVSCRAKAVVLNCGWL